MAQLRKCLAVCALGAVLNCGGEPVDRVEVVRVATTTIEPNTSRTVGHYSEVVRMRELADRHAHGRDVHARALAFVVAVAEYAGAVEESAGRPTRSGRASGTGEDGVPPDESAAASAPSGSCAIPAHICARESGFNPTVVSPNGLWHGKYQFTQSTFNHAVAGAGLPEYVGVSPEQAPEGVQDAAAAWLWAQPGGHGHWGER